VCQRHTWGTRLLLRRQAYAFMYVQYCPVHCNTHCQSKKCSLLNKPLILNSFIEYSTGEKFTTQVIKHLLIAVIVRSGATERMAPINACAYRGFVQASTVLYCYCTRCE